MDLSGRPKLGDFAGRAGSTFKVVDPHGRDAGTWRLEQCDGLPNPALEVLAGADCFSLEFSAGQAGEQGAYRLRSEDGFEVELFAVPVGPQRMHVTIN